jgi:hypothetical protein
MSEDINKRLEALENELRTLKQANKTEQTSEKPKKEKKEKKPRAPTEYNKFVSEYINGQKEKLGDEFKHKVAFSEAAKLWSEQKKTKGSD